MADRRADAPRMMRERNFTVLHPCASRVCDCESCMILDYTLSTGPHEPRGLERAAVGTRHAGTIHTRRVQSRKHRCLATVSPRASAHTYACVPFTLRAQRDHAPHSNTPYAPRLTSLGHVAPHHGTAVPTYQTRPLPSPSSLPNRSSDPPPHPQPASPPRDARGAARARACLRAPMHVPPRALPQARSMT